MSSHKRQCNSIMLSQTVTFFNWTPFDAFALKFQAQLCIFSGKGEGCWFAAGPRAARKGVCREYWATETRGQKEGEGAGTRKEGKAATKGFFTVVFGCFEIFFKLWNILNFTKLWLYKLWNSQDQWLNVFTQKHFGIFLKLILRAIRLKYAAFTFRERIRNKDDILKLIIISKLQNYFYFYPELKI